MEAFKGSESRKNVAPASTKCAILDHVFETSNKGAGSIQGNSPTGLETPAEHLTGPTLVVYRKSGEMIRRRNRNIRTYDLRCSHKLSVYGKSSGC